MEQRPTDVRSRRDFFAWAGKRGLQLGVLGFSLPAIAAACARDETAGPAATGTATGTPGGDEARAIVGDVVDFELTSSEWAGPFGFVTFRLHRGTAGGSDVYYIRTDASDESFADEEGLVWVPKLAGLATDGPTADAYLFDGDHPAVFSTQPGSDDYTPAWRVHRVRFTGEESELSSVADVEAAGDAGDVDIEQTDIVLNAPVVKWSGGEMPADTDERTSYLGPGQLLEPPDTDAMQVRFKLHECFPGVRYIVTDVGAEPMAEGMNIVYSPGLAGTSAAEATGRTNVFMNGIEGPGPMGFQPSVFDSAAGDAQWSPYWDHFTYGWKDEADARVLTTERAVHAARDDGELDEFPGTADTDGEIFVVNCPVPVVAPNTFTGD